MKGIEPIHGFLKKSSFRIFEIHEKDREKLVYLSFLNFIMMFANAFGISIATSLLLKKTGISFLPSMYLINSFIIGFISFLVFPFITKTNQISILKKIFLFFSFGILLAKIAAGAGLAWVYPVLYLASSLFGWVYYTQFWTLATDVCNIREGKRMFSLVVSAGILGGIAGGFATNTFVRVIHTENLLYIWSFLFFGIGIVMNFFEKSFPSKLGKNVVSNYEKISIVEDFVKIWKNFRENSLLKIIAITFFMYAMIIYLLDFLFNSVLNNSFKAADSLTGFYGNYYGVFYAITFIVVVLFASKILKKWGVGKVMLSLPVVVGLGFLLLVFDPGLKNVVSVKFLRDVVGSSVIESSYPLLFLPIAEELRRESFAFVDSYIMTAGIFTAGLLITLLLKFFGINSIIIAGLLLSTCWVFFSFKLKKEYFRTFVNSIDSKSYFEKEQPLNEIIYLGNKETIEILTKSLYDKNEKISFFSIELLGKIGDKVSSDVLFNFVKDSDIDPKRKAKALLMLGNSKDFTQVFNLMPFLNDNDPRIKANTLEAIGRLDPSLAKDVAENFLNDENSRVRMNAAIIIWKYSNKEKGSKILKEMSADPNPENRIRAIYALSEIGSKEVIDFVEAAINDENEDVRFYAARILEGIKTEKSVRLLINMLNDKKRKVRQAASQVLEKRSIKKNSDLFLNAMEKEGELAQKEIVFLMMKNKNEKYINAMLNYCRKEIKKIYENLIREDKIVRYRDSVKAGKKEVLDSLNIIIDSMRIRNERKLFKILRLLSGIKDSSVFTQALRRLKDPFNSEGQANAVDVIENILGFELASILMPLIENTTLNEKISIGKSLWKFDDYNANLILKEMSDNKYFKGMSILAGYVLNGVNIAV